MITPEQAAELVRANAGFGGHDDDLLERGLIPFATIKQAGFIASLSRKCGCPEERRLWLVGRFVDRELRSTKDLSLVEADALINWLLVGSDGTGDQRWDPCAEAVEVVGIMLDT